MKVPVTPHLLIGSLTNLVFVKILPQRMGGTDKMEFFSKIRQYVHKTWKKSINYVASQMMQK